MIISQTHTDDGITITHHHSCLELSTIIDSTSSLLSHRYMLWDEEEALEHFRELVADENS